jgi:hypothetical protein
MLNLLRRWLGTLTSAGRNGAPKGPKYQARLRLNALEDRLAPAVFNVNSTADILDPAPGVVTLRSAIEAANATPGGNTINLTVAGNYMITLPGTPGEVDNAAGEFAISSAGGNLTIQNTSGGDVTVDGNHLARVFDINPIFTVGSVTVTDGGSGFIKAPTVTFTGGGTGATAIASIANGQVTSVTITNAGTGYTSPPTITFSGGGGKGAAATAIMTSPKIAVTMIGFTIENGVAGPGNGTAGEGGGIRDNDNASLILNDMVITDNSALSDGGGVAMANVLSTPWLLSLTNTTISDNHAGDKGGGVDEDGTGKTIISGGLVTGNTSGGEGAGVNLNAISQGELFSIAVTNGGSGFTSPPTVTIAGGGGTGATGTAIISHGRVIGVAITNPGTGFIAAPTISFSGGSGKGAAATATLTSESGGLSVTGTVITDNKSFASDGGGVANSGTGAVTITNSTIANNIAATTGGGFSDKNNQGSLVVTNSLFLDNAAFGDGGGIFVGSPETTFINSQIEDNISDANGGGIFAGGVKLTIESSTINNNISFGNGGGIEIDTSGAGATNGSTITNSTITGNRTLNIFGFTSGGGIGTTADFTGSLLLQNDTINGNDASIGGGVASDGAAGSTIDVENTIIAGNFVNLRNFGVNGADAVGAFTDEGGNLIGISGTRSGNTGFTASTTQTGTTADPLDPLLGPLQDNGGPNVGAADDSMTLQTEALLPDSKAIAKGIAGGPAVDERGFSLAGEAQGTPPDVGAFQFQNATLSVAVGAPGSTVNVGDSETFTITVSNTSVNALPNDNSLVTVTLPSNLTITMVPPGATVARNTITFSLGALGANSQVQFQVSATADTSGTGLSVAASVTSPDSNPNSVSGSTLIAIQ